MSKIPIGYNTIYNYHIEKFHKGSFFRFFSWGWPGVGGGGVGQEKGRFARIILEKRIIPHANNGRYYLKCPCQKQKQTFYYDNPTTLITFLCLRIIYSSSSTSPNTLLKKVH